MLDKHKSKLHKGFKKQVQRQDLKPDFAKVEINPIILSWDDDEGMYLPLKAQYYNRKWNGINLKNLYHSFTPVEPNSMYSKRRINKEGKYTLSMHGKSILAKKRKRKQAN